MNTNSKINFHLLFFVVVLYSFTRCTPSKKIDPLVIKADVIIENSVTVKPIIFDIALKEDYIPDLAPEQETFDWENLDYLPMPFANDKTRYPMPWSDKANRHFSDDIRFDMKKSDGWELYLSTFSTKIRVSGFPSFSLYNKYKGILRYYFFNDISTKNSQGYNIFLNNMHLVGGHASSSPMLNFASQRIIDIDKNSTLCSTIEPQPLSDSTWYEFEYDLAFDKDIYSQNSSSILFANNFSMLNLPSMVLNGKELNKLNTKVRFMDVELGRISSYSGDVNLLLYGKNDLNQVSDFLSASDLTELNQIMDQHSFNHILNGTVDNNSLGDMQWDAHLKFTLDLSGVGMGSDAFYVSGADNSVVQGLCPFYTKALGVFYLIQKPIYAYTKLTDNAHSYQYALDVSSVQYIFNPSVLEIAEIKNIQQVLVATESKSLFQDYSNVKLFTGQKLTSNIPLTIQGVRVSFDVVPKDGGKTVHIMKTFQANQKNTELAF